ncbi:hypothetical protein INR49_004710 [Caranx melampygus]|nr:hypothetical protein INR49_004710 [Caranx melampygus]
MELLPSVLSTLKSLDPATLDQEYSAVRSQTLSIKKDLGLTTEAGALKDNIKKNRYKDILPYDQSRVVLFPLTSNSDSDYINASFIKGVVADNKYIACQGPLSSTVIDFWRMIWQHDVKVIVMACREIEMGKQGETHLSEDIVVRALTVTYQQDSRSVIHYQFLSWPDHDVPYEAAGVVDLLEIKLTEDFSIKGVVLELRRQRPSAVQTKDQYHFIFTAVTCMFERALQPKSQQLYCNLSQLQKPDSKTKQHLFPGPRGTSIYLSVCLSVRLSSKVVDMNDTYAVVNKAKQPHPPATSPAHSVVIPPRSSRSLPPSHHYDNESEGASAAPVYSSVKPRAKPQSMLVSTTPIYDIATSANQKPGRDYCHHTMENIT